MSYQLDLVFSRNKAIIATETKFIHPLDVVGSVKTTSKDRIDKVFLDKYLLTKLLGRDIPVIAIFLHDVQRAKRGNSIFGINSTFKSNHFLGYTVALNKLDGVYYVDPRPEMTANERLREQIHDFQQFLVKDLWRRSPWRCAARGGHSRGENRTALPPAGRSPTRAALAGADYPSGGRARGPGGPAPCRRGTQGHRAAPRLRQCAALRLAARAPGCRSR